MAADADGNLWVGEQEKGKLVKVDHNTGKVTEFPIPTPDSGPFSIDTDVARNVIWFGENFAGKLVRFDPRDNTFAEFPLPAWEPSQSNQGADNESRLIWIAVDPRRPNRVWWGGGPNARVGYIEVVDSPPQRQ